MLLNQTSNNGSRANRTVQLPFYKFKVLIPIKKDVKDLRQEKLKII